MYLVSIQRSFQHKHELLALDILSIMVTSEKVTTFTRATFRIPSTNQYKYIMPNTPGSGKFPKCLNVSIFLHQVIFKEQTRISRCLKNAYVHCVVHYSLSQQVTTFIMHIAYYSPSEQPTVTVHSVFLTIYCHVTLQHFLCISQSLLPQYNFLQQLCCASHNLI